METNSLLFVHAMRPYGDREQIRTKGETVISISRELERKDVDYVS